jgi:phage tail-like protein
MESQLFELDIASISPSLFSGLAIDDLGNAYISESDKNLVYRCDHGTLSLVDLGCFMGKGDGAHSLNHPTALAVDSNQILFVADSGNQRIYQVDLQSLQIIGQIDIRDAHEAKTIVDLVSGKNSDLYLLTSAGRVLRLEQSMQQDTKFSENIESFLPEHAHNPAISMTLGYLNPRQEDSLRLFLLHQDAPHISVFSLDGTQDNNATELWNWVTIKQEANLGNLTSLVISEDRVYIGAGDGQSGGILTLSLEGGYIGRASGFDLSVKTLAADYKGALLAYSDATQAVYRFRQTAAAESGYFWMGPVSIPKTSNELLHVHADVSGQEPMEFQFYTLVRPKPETVQVPEALAEDQILLESTFQTLESGEFPPANQWVGAPASAADFLAKHKAGEELWLICFLNGNGVASPSIEQIRISFDSESWLEYLPTPYRQDAHENTLQPALAFFKSILDDQVGKFVDLPMLFDPHAAPDESTSDWLDWLSGWLDFRLDENWTSAKRRDALANAYALHKKRGTADGLREIIKLYTGIDATISEPAQTTSLWVLGDAGSSTLGLNTMLVPEHPQGAVLDTTATLDASHLIMDEEYGAALLKDVMHRFCVQVYASDLDGDEELERLKQLIDREKPAHTEYHLCILKPNMRVGYQARIGIDAIVAGPDPDLRLASSHELGEDTVTAKPEGYERKIGQGAHIDGKTRLS